MQQKLLPREKRLKSHGIIALSSSFLPFISLLLISLTLNCKKTIERCVGRGSNSSSNKTQEVSSPLLLLIPDLCINFSLYHNNASAFIQLQLLFGLFDYLFEKDKLQQLAIYRYGLFLPLLLICMVIVNKAPFFWRFNQAIFSSMVLIFGAGLLTSGYIAQNIPDFYFLSLNFPMGLGFCFLMVHPLIMLVIAGLFMGMMCFSSSAIIDDIILSRAVLYGIVYFFFWGIFIEVQLKQEFMLKRSLKLEKKQLTYDKDTSEQLITNILPKLIADRVKNR